MAPIGAAAGAAVQVLTQGKEVRVPAESVLRFRLDEPIQLANPLTAPTERRLVELWIGLRVFTLIWAALWYPGYDRSRPRERRFRCGRLPRRTERGSNVWL